MIENDEPVVLIACPELTANDIIYTTHLGKCDNNT